MELSQPLRRSKRLCMKKEKIEEEKNLSTKRFKTSVERKRPWSDLPYDLLEQIADRLALLELFSFRSACKHWRFASSKALAKIESATGQEPWFLLYGNNSHCSWYDPSSERIYTIYIPELEGAECIASIGGWLLLYQNGSLFFFCPFSGAKLDLPKFPLEELFDHIATFSSAPTSPDCIVCVGTKTSTTQLELYVLRRGANEWVKYEDFFRADLKAVTCAALCDGILYFLDSINTAVTFSLEDEKWNAYRMVSSVSHDMVPRTLPFASRRTYFNNKVKKKLGLKDSDSLSICGTQIQGNHFSMCIHNEEIMVEEGKDIRRNKGVWFQPRFFQLPANQSWFF